jgi:hypothetical protein
VVAEMAAGVGGNSSSSGSDWSVLVSGGGSGSGRNKTTVADMGSSRLDTVKKKKKIEKNKPLAQLGTSTCISQWAGCLWTWQRWWQQRWKWWQAWAAVGQTRGRRAWGFKLSVTVKRKKRKKKKKQTNKPLAQSGVSACISQQAGCLWTWQR